MAWEFPKPWQNPSTQNQFGQGNRNFKGGSMRALKTLFVSLIFLLFTENVFAQDSPGINDRFENLEGRINRLEKRKTDTSNASTTATGLSRKFNPAISANGLLLGTFRSVENDNRDAEIKTGLDIQEFEFQLTSFVDPYLKANFILSMEELDEIEIEEGYVDILVVPQLAIRTGKFFNAFGKHNLLHTHAFPFIDAPLINEEILGDEGINEIGVGMSYLFPAPWYSELTFQFLEGDNEKLFDAPLNDDFAYLFHLKNFWDVNDDTTLELGGSFAIGKNSFGEDNSTTHLVGGDLTVKWVPAQRAKYRTLIWQTEYIESWQETGVDPVTLLENPDEEKGGIYTLAQYQLDRRWWVQGRYDYFGLHNSDDAEDKDRWSALLAFVPSEFSAVRLQYNYINPEAGESEHQIFLQLNYTIGAHPAHKY